MSAKVNRGAQMDTKAIEEEVPSPTVIMRYKSEGKISSYEIHLQYTRLR
jgi:hypothetical protein